MDLLNLEPNVISVDMASYRNFIYGTPKIGKTTFMYNLYKEEMLLIATEKGYSALNGVFAIDCGSYGDMMKIKQQLKKPEVKQRFKVVAIDTIDIMWGYIKTYVMQKHSIQKMSDLGYGAAWDEAKTLLRSYLDEIEKAGYQLQFISHAKTKVEKVVAEDGNEVEFEKYIPTLQASAKEIVSGLVDNILFATVAIDQNGQEQRVLYTRETTQFEAGTRFKNMKPIVKLNADSFTEEFKRAAESEGTFTQEVVSKVVETSEDKADFETLMTKARQIAGKLNEAGRLAEVTPIVEKHFGVGKRLTEATPEQMTSLLLAVEEMENIEI